MQIEILPDALDDLEAGYEFYERQEANAGQRFVDALYGDIETLGLNAGIHAKVYKNFYRAVSRRYPFAIYYTIVASTVLIHAVIDCRRNPNRVKLRFPA